MNVAMGEILAHALPAGTSQEPIIVAAQRYTSHAQPSSVVRADVLEPGEARASEAK